MQWEIGTALSHSYLSQLESGSRVHLSASSRVLLSSFFKVHPGYLVGDPPGYGNGGSLHDAATEPIQLGGWLAERAEEVRDDPLLYRALLRLARQPDPRQYLLLLDDLLDLPAARIDALRAELVAHADDHARG